MHRREAVAFRWRSAVRFDDITVRLFLHPPRPQNMVDSLFTGVGEADPTVEPSRCNQDRL